MSRYLALEQLSCTPRSIGHAILHPPSSIPGLRFAYARYGPLRWGPSPEIPRDEYTGDMTFQSLSSNSQDYLKVIWDLQEWTHEPIQP
ncbi:MAG: hypothetical protein ACTMHZ_07810, partial [Bifidobacterium psychraerophilum]